MKTNRMNLYLVLSWILSVGVAYVAGWWTGLRSATRVAAGAAHSGMWLILAVLAVVAISTAVVAFRARGLLDRNHKAM